MYTANKARCSTVWLRVLGWCWLLQSSWRTGCSVMLLWTSRGTTTCFRGWTNMRTKLCWNTQLGPSSLWLRVSYLLIMRAQYTGLFEMTVGVLTTCHTQYTWDSSISVFFYLIEQHSKFLLHTLQVLYMCTFCDSTNINTIIEFVPRSMSAVMVSMAVLIHTFSSVILAGRGGT